MPHAYAGEVHEAVLDNERQKKLVRSQWFLYELFLFPFLVFLFNHYCVAFVWIPL